MTVRPSINNRGRRRLCNSSPQYPNPLLRTPLRMIQFSLMCPQQQDCTFTGLGGAKLVGSWEASTRANRRDPRCLRRFSPTGSRICGALGIGGRGCGSRSVPVWYSVGHRKFDRSRPHPSLRICVRVGSRRTMAAVGNAREQRAAADVIRLMMRHDDSRTLGLTSVAR